MATKKTQEVATPEPQATLATPQVQQTQVAASSWPIAAAIFVGLALIALGLVWGLSQEKAPVAEEKEDIVINIVLPEAEPQQQTQKESTTTQQEAIFIEEQQCNCCDYSTAKSYGYHGEFDPDPINLHKKKGWITPSYALFKSNKDGHKGLDYAMWLHPGTQIPEDGIVYFFRCKDDPEVIFEHERIYWKKIFSTTGELLFEQ